jgi:tetratricopeptide (TPR) repeat protein
MWQPDGTLIQIEVGAGIVKDATAPDERNIIDKILNQPAPEEGQNLVAYTQQLRDYLWRNENLFLPTINYRDDPQLQSNEVTIYFGLEVRRFTVTYINDIFNFLIQKFREYNAIPADINSIRQWLFSCLEYIQQENYQYAFEIYQKAYYHSVQHNYDYELIQCLSAIGNILLINGDVSSAATLLSRAAFISTSSNIVDASFKAQIALNAANIWRFDPTDLTQPLQFYLQACHVSYYCGNSTIFFLSLIGQAEIHYLSRNYNAALFTFEQAKLMVLTQPNPANYQIAFNLQQNISAIWQHICYEQQHQQTGETTPASPSLFEEIKKVAISAIVNSVITAGVFKIFQVAGISAISIFGKSEYKFNQPIFNAPTVIGDNNLQKLINWR